jgi:hypothetical protein
LSEEIVDRRFPIERKKYIQSVGKLLEHRLGQIFQELGFETEIAKGQGNGLDIKVFRGNSLIIVGEVFNRSVRSSLSKKNKAGIIRNLSSYGCEKVLIYTCLQNKSILEDFPPGIFLLEIGYQIQPKFFYDFWARRNQVTLREIDSRETRQDIKSKLIDYLHSIELYPIPLVEVISQAGLVSI